MTEEAAQRRSALRDAVAKALGVVRAEGGDDGGGLQRR